MTKYKASIGTQLIFTVYFLLLHCNSIAGTEIEMGNSTVFPTNTYVKSQKKHHDFKKPCAITYSLDCGRFGDQLINYIKALWISYMYDGTLFYRPFTRSDELQLSLAHLHLKDYKSTFSKEKIKIKTEESLNELIEALKNPEFSGKTRLYSISFHSPIQEWEDIGFRSYLQKMIKPIIPVRLLEVPENCITVAVHVRTGAGYDTEYDINKMPTKFPPYSFYINGIRQVAEYYKDQPLYIYIFTDFPEPGEICNHFLEELNVLNISNEVAINYRLSKNNFKTNVLEDFFSMMQFDCMIRPDSSYSRASAAVSGPIIEITPACWGHFRIDKDGKVIMDSQVKIRSTKGGIICNRFS